MRIDDEIFVTIKNQTYRGNVESLTSDGEMIEVAYKKRGLLRDKKVKQIVHSGCVKKIVYEADAELGEFSELNFRSVDLDYLQDFLEKRFKEAAQKDASDADWSSKTKGHNYSYSLRSHADSELNISIEIGGSEDLTKAEFTADNFQTLNKKVKTFIKKYLAGEKFN